MAKIIADSIQSRTDAALSLPSNINTTGVVTVTTLSGNVSGVAGTFTGDVSVRNLTGVAATFTGVLTYEDVTNVDAIGIITAQSGIQVAGVVTAKAGSAVTYYGDGSGLSGIESWNQQDTWLYS